MTSCEYRSLSENVKNEFGLTAKQMKLLGIVSIKKYTPQDPGYAEASSTIRERYYAHLRTIHLQNRVIPQDPDVGNYYQITSAAGGVTEALAEPQPQQYFVNTTVLPNLPTVEFNYDLVPVSNPQPYTFGYTMYNYRPNGLPFIHNRPDGAKISWWECVTTEYNNMCGSPLQELMCAAAGVAAPEIVLIVYASWMLSCAW